MLLCTISMCRRATACAPSSATRLAAVRVSRFLRLAVRNVSMSGSAGNFMSAKNFVKSMSDGGPIAMTGSFHTALRHGGDVAPVEHPAQCGAMITPLSSHTGAEVTGVDLTLPVDVALRERLNRAFVEHSVLVFRNQHLSPRQLLVAVQLFRS